MHSPYRERHFRLLAITKYSAFSLFLLMLVLVQATSLVAQEDSDNDEAERLRKRRDVAVALNYCRAAFHRIRKYPTQAVIHEEQEKILNNLNLNGIQDEEIINLYTDVLDEISQIQLTDKETELFETKYQRAVRQELAFDSLSIGLNLLSAQYLGAVRTGANSWWDFRNFSWTRDHEAFKLEKARMNSVVKKSSSFLDTFWKLTQENQIPDRWLIRSTDLDELEQAMNEKDLEKRLRILKRMEPFMECYPPYWYYIARTQQSLGDLEDSVRSYDELATLGTNHFRRDDMLASAFANQAVILAHLGRPEAVETARKALGYSTQVWEANLACARILQRAGQLAQAEDAILRNLDVGLEAEQSTVTLLTFYHDTHNKKKLAKYLGDKKTLAYVPPPVLIRFASSLSEDETPPLVWTALASSLRLYPEVGFGDDDVYLACHPVWNIERGNIVMHRADGTPVKGEHFKQGDVDIIRFAKVGDFGGILSGVSNLPGIKLDMQYGEADPIRLSFAGEALPGTEIKAKPANDSYPKTEPRSYHLVAAHWGNRGVAYTPSFPKTAGIYESVKFDEFAALIDASSISETKSAQQPEESVAPEDASKIR